MPQVHNKSLAMETSLFGKNSRFMSTLRMSEGSKRKIRAFNTVESRLNRFKINYYARHADIQLNKRKREKDHILEAIKKRNAYKFVIRNHRFTDSKDYKKSLDDRYNAHALRFEIRDMMKFMKPDRIRERNAHVLIEENRKRYDKIIDRNRNSIQEICPEITKKYSYDDSEDEFESDSEDEEEKKKQEMTSKRATLSFQRQGVTKAFVLQSGRTEVDLKLPKDLTKKGTTADEKAITKSVNNTPRGSNDKDNKSQNKTETKSNYELPPVVVKKQMDPKLKVPV
ncbi:hypothetical protein FSP39_012141 [Pinctada imbricata]|uniref:Uncharacterized protein n=1 Tax=Pinctada imbricata TaxID=66713 RepID=A0AA88YIY8_PINIB|nr:hypothetical protein FSP39_012141 [Pinctada imbricata]